MVVKPTLESVGTIPAAGGGPDHAVLPKARRDPARRTVIGAALGATLVGSAGAGGALWRNSKRVRVPLLSETVALSGFSRPTLVPPGRGEDVIPSTRILHNAEDLTRLFAAERSWFRSGAEWTQAADRWSELTRSSLADIRALMLPSGAVVAGWSPAWRYIWPRDSAHVAVALAKSGLASSGIGVLQFLSRVQSPSGWFEARYRPDGSGPPDARGRQLDGTGWVLWAARHVIEALSADSRARLDGGIISMVDRSVSLILSTMQTPSGLPSPSPDYWEVQEDVLTLGTVAPLAAGLSNAAALYTLLGNREASKRASEASLQLRATVDETFGQDGYPRHLHGDDYDAAPAFLLPPYTETSSLRVLAAVSHSQGAMHRPAGGLAPGTGWKDDGISWTPETAQFALAHAANGNHTEAVRHLEWLEAHRTMVGAFPEKVLYDGSPAGVAPLAWTAALVLLAIRELSLK